jgi:hypothetical protein
MFKPTPGFPEKRRPRDITSCDTQMSEWIIKDICWSHGASCCLLLRLRLIAQGKRCERQIVEQMGSFPKAESCGYAASVLLSLCRRERAGVS